MTAGLAFKQSEDKTSGMNNTRHITLSFSCSLNGNYGSDKIKAILKTNKNQIKALGKMVLLACEVVSVYCLENP